MYNRHMQKKKRWLIPAVIIGILVLFCVVTYIVTPLVIVRPNYNEKAA